MRKREPVFPSYRSKARIEVNISLNFWGFDLKAEQRKRHLHMSGYGDVGNSNKVVKLMQPLNAP